MELRANADAPSERSTSGDLFPIGAYIALGVLVFGAGGLYAVRLRRG